MATRKPAEMPKGTGTFKRVISHDDKPDFWKPSKIGEQLYGKLIANVPGTRGGVLHIQTFDGEVKQFGIPTQLRRLPWDDFIGKDVKVSYMKSVPTTKGNPAKLFDVDVAE